MQRRFIKFGKKDAQLCGLLLNKLKLSNRQQVTDQIILNNKVPVVDPC